MKISVHNKAGNAIFWQSIQYGSEKVIFFLRLFILAKLLTPDDFGLLAIASVALDFLMRISNFGMIPALIHKEDATEDLFDAAWTIIVLRALAITLVIFFSAPIIAAFFVEPRTTNILRALAFRPLIDGTASIMVTRFTRNLDFRSLVFMQLPKSITNLIVSIALAKWFGVWALVAGSLAGPGIYLVLSYIFAPHKPRFIFNTGAIRALISFGRWVFWTSIIVMLGQTLLRLLISRELGATDLGLYYLATSLAFLPTDIATQIVGEVAFPFYSRLQNDIKQATEAFKAILTSLTVLLLPMSALLISLAPSIVNNVLDERWIGTVRIIQILVLANIVDMVGETISPILNGTGHPDKVMIMETVQSLAMVILAWSLTGKYGLEGAAIAWIPSVIVSQVIGLTFLSKILTKPFRGLGIPLISVSIVSLSSAVAAHKIILIMPGLGGLILASVVGFLIVAVPLWCLERRFALGLSSGLIRAFPKIAALLGLDKPVNGNAIG